jgi:polysaccharide export outer membrane protein
MSRPGDLGIQLVGVTDAVARAVSQPAGRAGFAERFGGGEPVGMVIGRGDTVSIAVWEAPPATLFGAGFVANASAWSVGGNPETSRPSDIGEQMVNGQGRINMPFAGSVPAAGFTPEQVAAQIEARLAGKAHQPQVIVRITRNQAASATVVGEVNQSLRLPLTAHGERLLDALAAAGGTRQPTSKVMLRLSRGDLTGAMPLDDVIRDPRQNIVLRSGDVVTALYQPFTFTVLGATGRNEEIAVEAQGISLAQALARAGGLQDQRANPQGVFVFRFEDPAMLPAGLMRTQGSRFETKVPVIYQIDLRDPASLFVAQDFVIRDKDLVYVANAPMADLLKFTALVSSVVYPAVSVSAVVP